MPPKLNDAELREMLVTQNEYNTKLADKVDSLVSVVESLTTLLANVSTQNSELIAQIRVLTEQNAKLIEKSTMPPTPMTYGKPPNFSLQLVKALDEAQQLKDKSLRAVIEFLPEAASETTTIEQDRSFVESVATAMGNTGVQFDSIKRHGNKVENRNRIVKVPFDTTENHNHFIRKFRVTVNTLQNPPNVRIRRDMVQSELELLRQCRAECREKNEKANEMRFYVQDLEIKETASPKPLRRFPRA
ncbi:hypothetical protein DdX_07004 [Ditylenchus destructor]|uniref:Uncharacterized protein n=1 Tax=Ditylenchus destructor TaxID=166010 RepID=A0AAD4N6Z1_9BILA|nr:hypothetical protein DdX_07004 [Ditylenchus destructor]